MRRWPLFGLAALCLVAGGVPAAPGKVAGFVVSNHYNGGLAEPATVGVLADGGLVVGDIALDAVKVLEPDGRLRWERADDLHHPSGVAVTADGIWVADAGHHRLVLLDATDGQLLTEIELDPDVQPIDLCVDGDGLIWVSATPQDRILVLDADGETVLDIDQVDGRPLEGPRGIESDGEGGVFVVEVLAGKVLHLSETGDLLGTLGDWGPGAGRFYKPKDVAVLPDGAVAITDSHKGAVQILERDGSFRQLVSGADAPQLFEFPLGIAAHGASLYVADAGARAAYRLDPAGAAWRDGGYPPSGSLAEHASVRDPNPSFVCRQCHDGTRVLDTGNWDPSATNHPLELEGEAEIPARFRLSDEGDLTCHTCHFVHSEDNPSAHQGVDGPVVDFGLIREESDTSRFPGNDLCVECHSAYLDTETSHRRKSHPIGLEPPAGTSRQGLLEAGARFEGGRLVCMTCHPPHGAHADPLLITVASSGDLCISCHADHSSRYSRHAVDVEVDRITHNRVEAMGGIFAPDGHLTCLSCHDPHQTRSATLLRTAQSGTDACRACHVEEARLIRSGSHGDTGCESCHGMHTQPSGYGDGERRDGVGPVACLDCHADGSDDPQISLFDSHPMATELEDGEHGSLPPYEGGIGCSTCHDAHGGADAVLRTDGGVAGLCLECHEEKGTVIGTDHDGAIASVWGEDQTCVSCHAPHGSDAPYLVADIATGVNPANGRCLACHDGSTDATTVEHYTHPERLMLTVGGLPFRYSGSVPYYGPDGEQTNDREVGEITCMTCHDPHRWRHDAQDRPGAMDGSEQNSFLRDPDEIVRFCEVCHGVEGRPQLTFFHDDEYRLEADLDGENP